MVSLVLDVCLLSPIQNVGSGFGSLALDKQRGQKENFMKKDEKDLDELRPEYHREDFGPMVRGKYAKRMKKVTNIVVLDPDVAEAFPNGERG